MTAKQQFEVMTNMLSGLKDGRVDLYTSFDVSRYWLWHEDYPKNYFDSLQRFYLKTDYPIVSGLDYTVLDGNIGYIHRETLQNVTGAGNLDDIPIHLQPYNGLTTGVCNNGSGNLTNAETFAVRLTNEGRLVGYAQHKTGKGHNDFSALQPEHLKPGKGIRWQKSAIVLTSRGVFPAVNESVKYMKCYPNVTIVGDRTGGGAGLPFSSELPNGWSVRFSVCPMCDRDKQMTEFGIDPDYRVSLTSDDSA